ncbi:TniQ protein [Salipiger marinus]|uniref:TniQ protein n=3 Tax=Salipiger marinus TaxID=555512 RepID=A0A1G8M2Q8_9RHOB|nr:TniQ protein [Salipiger marinus]
MTAAIRLPVAPRPFRDELLSSWMVRVASRYGLEVPEVTTHLVGQGGRAPDLRKIDDISPDRGLLRLWARGCRIDSARLERLSLKSRYPDRLQDWFVDGAGGVVPACLACFDADLAAGRDSHMRAEWQLAERVVCPSHKEMLRDRCPDCGCYLRISFRMRGGRLRPFCRKCDGLITGRGGEAAVRSAVEFAIAVLSLQRRAGRIVRGEADLLAPLAQAICTLWAPLDRMDAARPVLALWFDQPGWHCPFEVRAVVGTPAPLRRLPVRWRALTLVVLRDLFGAALVSDGTMPEAASRLFRRVAPTPYLSQERASGISKGMTHAARGNRGVQRLSKSPVHRLSGNFEGERADFG